MVMVRVRVRVRAKSQGSAVSYDLVMIYHPSGKFGILPAAKININNGLNNGFN